MYKISILLHIFKQLITIYKKSGWNYTKQKLYDYFLLLINKNPTTFYSPKYAILEKFNNNHSYSLESLSLSHYWKVSLNNLNQISSDLRKFKVLLVCLSKQNISKQLKLILSRISDQVTVIEINNLAIYYKRLLEYNFILLDKISINYQMRIFLRDAQCNYIPVMLWQDQNAEENYVNDLEYITNYSIGCDQKIIVISKQYILNNNKKITISPEINSIKFNQLLSEMTHKYKKKYLPKVTALCIIKKGFNNYKNILEFYSKQSYIGDIELVLIDTQIESDNIKYYDFVREVNSLDNYKLLKVKNDLSFYQTLNEGLESATGKIIFIHSAVTTDYNLITNHVAAHSFDDCDISVDYFFTKSNYQEEYLLSKISHINQANFLSFSNSNIGIKKNSLLPEKFDTNFLGQDPLFLGLLDLGYILYKQGKRFKFVSTELSNNDIYNKHQILSLSSFKNFLYLLKKHPYLKLVCRRWTLFNYYKLINDIPDYDHKSKEHLESLLNIKNISPLLIDSEKKKSLKVLTYPWHIPHQYEIYKLPYHFTLITDLGSGISRGWNLGQRPIPNNVRFKSIKDIDINDFDLAILHFDENVLAPENTHGAVGFNWGKSFRYFKDNINLPKIAICHGTPQFYGQYNLNYQKYNLMEEIAEQKQKLVKYLDNILTITNSHQANKEWNFKNTKVIWHGFDPLEFPETTYSKGILTPFGRPMISRPHYRGYYVFKEVFKNFPDEFAPSVLNVKEPHILYQGNQYAYAKFRNYVDDIRQYSIYFNPTIRSPMPRSRGEAMICGLVNVSLKNHDVDLFIENGVNGFYSEEPEELRDILLYLMKNPQQAENIGNKGRKLAMDIFNYDRFLQNWTNTINEVV
ncbi:MAG: glycosyltransferase [Xenococcaceae cyanobacterium MO_207.B15]|nr:glycosyltransferase [Xenococcaceae cyanobacterium MO_207.B15]